MPEEFAEKPVSLPTSEIIDDPPSYLARYNVGTIVGGTSLQRNVTLTPPTTDGFPTTPFKLSGSTEDGNGNTSYTTTVTLNGTASSSGVPVNIVVTNPPAGSFNALLTITVQVTYSDGKP